MAGACFCYLKGAVSARILFAAEDHSFVRKSDHRSWHDSLYMAGWPSQGEKQMFISCTQQAGKIFPRCFWHGMAMLALIWSLLVLATTIS